MMKQKPQNKEQKYKSLCSFSYMMKHGCNGCKLSKKCEELERKRYDIKKR